MQFSYYKERKKGQEYARQALAQELVLVDDISG